MPSNKLLNILGNRFSPTLEVSEILSTFQKTNVATPKSKPLSKLNQREYESCLLTWFDMAYYLLLCPYRFEIQDGRQTTHIKNNQIQKIGCVICHIFCLTLYLNEFRQTLSQLSLGPHNPASYLYIFLSGVSLIHHIVLIYLLWTKSKEFLKVIQNFMNLNKSLMLNKASPQLFPQWGVKLICLTYPLVSLITTPAATELIEFPEYALKEFVSRLKFGLFLQSTYKVNQTLIMESVNNGTYEITNSDAAFLALFFLMFAFRNSMGFCTDALILTTCLSLWFPVKQVANSILKESKNKIFYPFHFMHSLEPATIRKRVHANVVMDQYEILKNASKLINSAVSPLLLTFVLEGTLYYSVSTKSILSLNSPLLTIWLGFFFVSFAVIFFIAADISFQADTFKEWLAEESNRECLSDRELQYIMFELQESPIGLKCAGVFPINFSFVAAVCSSLMTYFIVTVQFE